MQVLLLQPGAWLGAFLHAAAAELALPASKASPAVLHSLLLPGAQGSSHPVAQQAYNDLQLLHQVVHQECDTSHVC